jgi:hypothetical protein
MKRREKAAKSQKNKKKKENGWNVLFFFDVVTLSTAHTRPISKSKQECSPLEISQQKDAAARNFAWLINVA